MGFALAKGLIRGLEYRYPDRTKLTTTINRFLAIHPTRLSEERGKVGRGKVMQLIGRRKVLRIVSLRVVRNGLSEYLPLCLQEPG